MKVLAEKEDCKIQVVEYEETGDVQLRTFWTYNDGGYGEHNISVNTDGEGVADLIKNSEEFFREQIAEEEVLE